MSEQDAKAMDRIKEIVDGWEHITPPALVVEDFLISEAPDDCNRQELRVLTDAYTAGFRAGSSAALSLVRDVIKDPDDSGALDIVSP